MARAPRQGLTRNKTFLEIFTAETHRNVATLAKAARPLVHASERDDPAISIPLIFGLAYFV